MEKSATAHGMGFRIALPVFVSVIVFSPYSQNRFHDSPFPIPHSRLQLIVPTSFSRFSSGTSL